MSSGDFKTNAIYELDNGSFTIVKVQPETLAATVGGVANAEGAGPKTPGYPRASVTRGNTEIGIRPRLVRCKWDDGGQPTGYTGKTFSLPIMDKAAFDAMAEDDAVAYLGGTAKVLFKVGESIR